MKRYLFFALLILSIFTFSCQSKGVSVNDNVVIFFTNDIQMAMKKTNDGNVGYASIKAYKQYAENSLRSHVALVDAGGFTYGDSSFATADKCSKVLDIVNKVGYDYVALSDEDFAYGLDVANRNIGRLSAKVLSCNFCKDPSSANNRDKRFGGVKTGYVIEKFGKTKVAFIGVTTNSTLNENVDMGIWTFKDLGETRDLINNLVNEAKTKGKADYVILLSHLGTVSGYSVTDIVSSSSGLTAVFDGHTVEGVDATNSKLPGTDIYYGHCGRYGKKVGKFVIDKTSTEPVITLEYLDIDDMLFQDYDLEAKINSLK